MHFRVIRSDHSNELGEMPAWEAENAGHRCSLTLIDRFRVARSLGRHTLCIPYKNGVGTKEIQGLQRFFVPLASGLSPVTMHLCLFGVHGVLDAEDNADSRSKDLECSHICRRLLSNQV